jgi:asparagine synthase (glutamine-hydrolysing)
MMCGLFGVVDTIRLTDFDIQDSKKALETLNHRGPDGSGVWFDEHVFLGHTRLSILDLSEKASQPMDSNDVVIAVNGEIYNYPYLKQELETLGYKFSSGSDSEVILHGYHAWGLAKLLESLEGMYAGVIYDRKKAIVHIFRERVGIKPIFVYSKNGRFVFASELSSIRNFVGHTQCDLDETALLDFLVYRFIPAPKTAFKEIKKLEAGTVTTFDLKKSYLTSSRYWSLFNEVVAVEDSKDKIDLVTLIETSVRDQLISDVPVGLFLSGGLDSSIVALLAAQKRKIDSYCIGYKGEAQDESLDAENMALHVGTNHHTEWMETISASDIVDFLIDTFDEPFGDVSAIPTHRVCQLARTKSTVALSGDGGDELFGGYAWYKSFDSLMASPFRRLLGTKHGWNIPSWIPGARLLHLHTIADPVVLYASVRKGLSSKKLTRWAERLGVAKDYDPYWAYRNFYRSELDPYEAARWMDFHIYLPDDILTKVDRTSMKVSLEVRPPFLSTAIIRFAFSQHSSFHVADNTLKKGLKEAFSTRLPDWSVKKTKQGFSLAGKTWRESVKKNGSIQEMILEKFIETHGIEP